MALDIGLDRVNERSYSAPFNTTMNKNEPYLNSNREQFWIYLLTMQNHLQEH